MRYTFSAKEKLKSRKQIGLLFTAGKSINQHPLRLKYLKVESDDAGVKAAFSVPKRSVKLAVTRNRLKRLMREAYRLNKHILLNNTPNQYIMMFIYSSNKELPLVEMEKKMIELLNKLIKTDTI